MKAPSPCRRFMMAAMFFCMLVIAGCQKKNIDEPQAKAVHDGSNWPLAGLVVVAIVALLWLRFVSSGDYSAWKAKRTGSKDNR